MPRKNKIIRRNGTGVPSASDFVTGEPAWDSTNKNLYIEAADGTMVRIGPYSAGSNITISTSGVISSTGGGGGSGTPELVYSYATEASFPGTGDATLLYFATDTGRMYRWTGSVYVEVGSLGGVEDTGPAGGGGGGVAADDDQNILANQVFG